MRVVTAQGGKNKNEEKIMVDLGWANGWREKPDIVSRCESQDHSTPGFLTDVDVGPPGRGIEHVVTCTECGYRYRYDSSD